MKLGTCQRKTKQEENPIRHDTGDDNAGQYVCGGRTVIGNNQVNNLSFQYTVYPSLLDDDDDEVEEVDGVDGNVIVL